MSTTGSDARFCPGCTSLALILIQLSEIWNQFHLDLHVQFAQLCLMLVTFAPIVT